LYVSFGSHGIFCYDLEGERIWDRDLGDMVTRFGWGEGASPVLHGDSADRELGPRGPIVPDGSGFGYGRNEAQVIVPATRRITSYDLATGEVIWECGGLTTNVIPAPVLYGDLVICMSGHGGNEVRAVRLDSRGDVTVSPQQVVWQSHRHAPYVPSPLVYGQQLFLTKSNLAILKILDPASGRTLAGSVRLPERWC
jgi:outer membrane protein assembly factor BamB